MLVFPKSLFYFVFQDYCFREIAPNDTTFLCTTQSTIDSEGFKGGTRGAPIMLRDAVSRTANVERTGQHKWVK